MRRAAAVVGMLEPATGRASRRRQPLPRRPAPALVGNPVLVDGRLPDPDAADEVAINELLADRADVAVDDRSR